MDVVHAKEIVSFSADGINPMTGEVLADDDCCNQADVVRALHTVLAELEKCEERKRTKPRNAGLPWSETELEKLEDEFDCNMKIGDIAKEHGRSKTAIEVKLSELGKIKENPLAKIIRR